MTADGVRLALFRFRPENRRPGSGVCLCTHAFMSRGSYLWRRGFVSTLVAAGLETYVLDWRGHGDSTPPRAGRGTSWLFDDYVELDLPAAVTAIRDHSGEVAARIDYVGHSLGSAVGLAAAATGVVSLRRFVSVAGALWLPGPGGSLIQRGLLRLGAATATVLGFLPVRTLRLGSDNESTGYMSGIARWAESGAWTSRTGFDYLEALGALDMPVLWVSGEQDRWLSPPKAVEQFAARAGGTNVLRPVGTAHGDAKDAGHIDILTDAALVPLWQQVAEFVAEGELGAGVDSRPRVA